MAYLPRQGEVDVIRFVILGALLAALALAPASARAFCGFYVGSSDGARASEATMVVLLRAGTQTVLSMRNDYHGPPEDFAMVVPVPEVLEEDQVRVLPAEVFARVERLISQLGIVGDMDGPSGGGTRPLRPRRKSWPTKSSRLTVGSMEMRKADSQLRIRRYCCVFGSLVSLYPVLLLSELH